MKSPTGAGNFGTLNASVNIYPNPNNGRFIIDMHLDNPLDKLVIDIYNTNGMKIRREEITEVNTDINHEIDLGNEASGLYLVKIITTEHWLFS